MDRQRASHLYDTGHAFLEAHKSKNETLSVIRARAREISAKIVSLKFVSGKRHILEY